MKSVPWYTTHKLTDVSLGSLAVLVLTRLAQWWVSTEEPNMVTIVMIMVMVVIMVCCVVFVEWVCCCLWKTFPFWHLAYD